MNGFLWIAGYLAVGAVVAFIAGPEPDPFDEHSDARKGGTLASIALCWPLVVGGFACWLTAVGIGRAYRWMADR